MRRSSLRPSRCRPRIAAACIVAVAAAVVGGCGASDSSYEVTDVRERPDGGPPPRLGASPASRFGAEDADAARPGWTAATPQGWTPLPPAPMRELGWRVAGDPKADCTFSTLGGTGGGLAANVNRWRKQMSLADTTPEEVAALPTRTWMGRPARVVELAGTFVGMGGNANVEGAKLLGLVLELPAATAFLKMTGPAAVVDAERERFFALADSLKMGAAPASDPHAGVGARDAAASAPAKAPFAWTVPAGWKEQGPRDMRVATWAPEGTSKTEVYVTVLAGTGGGAFANVNRWRGQVGLDDLTSEAFEQLPRAKVLGVDAVFVEVEGTFKGMAESGGDAGSMLLGMFLQRPGRAVTVKMTGPADEVRRERERFRAFCESFHE